MVVRPLTEMQHNMKLIRRTITKRDHKLVDYDRFRISLKKLQDKKNRTLSDEKQIYKVLFCLLFLCWVVCIRNGASSW
jgi:amphiphysin